MYKYDVAISFASEVDTIVQEVNDYLKAEKINTFFFIERQRELLSMNPYTSIYEVFQIDSLVKVLFITPKYADSKWTQIEKRRAIESTTYSRERLIVVNYMGNDLDSELNKYIFIDGNKCAPDTIAAMIAERVKKLKQYTETKKEAQTRNIIFENKGIVTGDYAVFQNFKIGED